jgi:hypothetical protein
MEEPNLYSAFLNLAMFYIYQVAGIIRFNLLYFRILATKKDRTFLPENASLFWCK